MFQIDVMSRKPIYEQIIEQIERFIFTGIIREGEQLPSVRSLSLELSINPNTIQKAYSELDSRGAIYSVPGKGCFVCDDAVNVLSEYKRSKLYLLTNTIGEMAIAGVTKEEVLMCVEEAFLKFN